MASGTDQYDGRFYDAIREGCQLSASATVPVFLEAMFPWKPASVIDIGCGEGWWAYQFADFARVLGVDAGGHDAAKAAPIERLDADISQPFEVEGGPWDLALCLEVAEHLPEDRAEGFVAGLVAASDVLLFSAAMPGQGGTGHVNCQPPTYWADKFAAHGYTTSGALRWDLWEHPDIEPWYKSNLLVSVRRPERFPHLFGPSHPVAQGPLHVVHPDLWIIR